MPRINEKISAFLPLPSLFSSISYKVYFPKKKEGAAVALADINISQPEKRRADTQNVNKMQSGVSQFLLNSLYSVAYNVNILVQECSSLFRWRFDFNCTLELRNGYIKKGLRGSGSIIPR